MSSLQPSAFAAKGGVSPAPYSKELRLKAFGQDPLHFSGGRSCDLIAEAELGSDPRDEAIE